MSRCRRGHLYTNARQCPQCQRARANSLRTTYKNPGQTPRKMGVWGDWRKAQEWSRKSHPEVVWQCLYVKGMARAMDWPELELVSDDCMPSMAECAADELRVRYGGHEWTLKRLESPAPADQLAQRRAEAGRLRAERLIAALRGRRAMRSLERESLPVEVEEVG